MGKFKQGLIGSLGILAIAAGLIQWQWQPRPVPWEKETLQSTLQFPDQFLWGTATAAYQVEGGIRNDWSQAGWDAGKAAEQYTRYPQDFALARAMGNNVHRFSIEWSRIEPQPGQWNHKEVAHYRQVLRSLKAHGLKPLVTLHHFTNPIWVSQKGGWTKDSIVADYIHYVTFIVNELKDEADFWCTVNEPVVNAFKSYDAGEWPPHSKDRGLALQVIKNYILAHGAAYQVIHEIQPQAKVGFAKHITILHPHWILNPVDNLMAYFQSELFNKAFWQALATGELKLAIPGVPTVEIPYNHALKGTMDYIGVNYYTRWLVTPSGKQVVAEDAVKSPIGWEIYPDGMLDALKMADVFAKQMQIPIYITENGIDDPDDQLRPRYMLTHLKKVWEAIQMGIPVKGYMHWSLIDNFEWVDRYKPKFGLYTLEREERSSAKLYQSINQNNGITSEVWKQYFKP